MEELAPIYTLDLQAAQIVGLLHDAGKELTQDCMIEIAHAINFPLKCAGDRDPLFLHGPCSAYVAEHDLGINDPLVLEAIFRHSFLGDGPALSPKFCWCLRFADMLEPSRDWTDAHERLKPFVFAGRMGEAALEQLNWLIPFLQGMGISPHPHHFVLRQEMLQFLETEPNRTNFGQIPV